MYHVCVHTAVASKVKFTITNHKKEREPRIMKDMRVCAACLATDVRMYSMSAARLLEPYRLLTGIKLESEVMPQKLCWECAALVHKFIMFRHKCERASLLLQDIYNQHDEFSEDSCRRIDRSKFKLTSHYGHSKLYISYYNDSDHKIVKREANSHSFFDDPNCDSDFEVNAFLDDVKLEVAEDDITLFDLSIEMKRSKKECRKSKSYCKKKDENVDILIKKELSPDIECDGNYDFLKVEPHLNTNEKSSKPVKSKVLKRKKGKQRSEISKYIDKKKRKRRLAIGAAERNTKREPLNKRVDFSDFATAVTLTQEQQMEEVRKRQETESFKTAYFKCTLCFKGFVNEKAYNNHMRKHDPSTGEYVCDVCQSRFRKRYYVADHIYKVHTTKYVCKFCPFVSQCVYQASTHYKWHKGVVYKCNMCTEEFTTKSTYLSHRRIKHASEHVCAACGESFVSRLGLLQHNSRLHKNMMGSEVDVVKGVEGPRCAECNVQFSSTEAYTKHMVISPRHAADSRMRNGCRDCGATFGTEKELRAHRTALHRRLKVKATERRDSEGYPVKCAQCEEMMENARHYWQHFRRAHPTERYPSSKPAICEYCGKGFKCKSVLSHHRNTHTGARSYACQLCPKSFYTPQNLDNHLKSHSERRPYVCDVCSKGFKFSVALLRHRRIHTGEKPYVCDVCGKAFTDSSGRKVHVRTVHLKEPTPYISKVRLERRRTVDAVKQAHVQG